MDAKDLQPQITTSIDLITGHRKLPQELCDLVISHTPQETLSQCSLVCRGWVRSSSRRLLETFSWPPRSIRSLARDSSAECFTDLFEALLASTRLQDAIHTLQLGSSNDPYYIVLSTPPYDIRVSTLISILGLCVSLDNIILRHCCIHANVTTAEAGQFDGLDTVTFSDYPSSTLANMRGIVEFLSLFKRINHLSVAFREPMAPFIEQSVSLPKSLELKSISWPESTFRGFQAENTPLYLLKYLQEISDIHEHLRSVSASFAPPNVLEYLRGMNHLEVLEIYVPNHHTQTISPIRTFTSLRRLVLRSMAQVGNDHKYWPLVMVHLGDIPSDSRLQSLAIAFLYVDAPRERLDDTLELFEKELLEEDWQPLERFTERCPSVSVEFRVRCAYIVDGRVDKLPEADPDRVVEVAHNAASKRLSEAAARRISVRHDPPRY